MLLLSSILSKSEVVVEPRVLVVVVDQPHSSYLIQQLRCHIVVLLLDRLLLFLRVV